MVPSTPLLLPAVALLLGAAALSPPQPPGTPPGTQSPGTGPGPGLSASGSPALRSPSSPFSRRAGPGITRQAASEHQQAPVQPTAAPRDGWLWPLAPRPAVVAPFRPPHSDWGAGHRGVDLAASSGQRVLSAAAGRVTHVGVIAGRGTLTVLHRDGVRTTYEPVVPRVREGDVVSAGQVIGAVADEGSSHCTTCLHFGALRGRVYLDPLALLQRRAVVLLPLR